jgi:AAHS family 4-hydroxybenzoate transporter-like MFS transporter
VNAEPQPVEPRPLPCGHVIDVVDIVEGQKLGGFTQRFILVCSLVMFLDGFDLNVIAFTADHVMKAYRLDIGMWRDVLTIGVLGTLFGSVAFGVLGDRLGRRRAIISATVLFGVLTLAFAAASSYWELLLFRLLNGIALGGAVPLVWALSVEYVPRRYRATIVTVIMLGYGIGVAVAGPIANGGSWALIPLFGWRSVFVFGGLASLIAAGLLYRSLPESLRFLATRASRSEQLARIVGELAPERTDLAGARFILSGQDSAVRGNRGVAASLGALAALFRGPLRWVTPLVWLAYAASSMNTFFFTNWGPQLFEKMGLTAHGATWSSFTNSVAGAIGAVLLMRFTDRVGPISVALLPAIAVPLLLFIGFVPVSHGIFIATMGMLYVFLGGSHYGIISISGTFYPTTHRALGTGWVSAAGKVGSVAGPWLGGLIMAAVLASHIPPQRAFVILAVCPTLFFFCMLIIGLMERQGTVRAAE